MIVYLLIYLFFAVVQPDLFSLFIILLLSHFLLLFFVLSMSCFISYFLLFCFVSLFVFCAVLRFWYNNCSLLSLYFVSHCFFWFLAHVFVLVYDIGYTCCSPESHFFLSHLVTYQTDCLLRQERFFCSDFVTFIISTVVCLLSLCLYLSFHRSLTLSTGLTPSTGRLYLSLTLSTHSISFYPFH